MAVYTVTSNTQIEDGTHKGIDVTNTGGTNIVLSTGDTLAPGAAITICPTGVITATSTPKNWQLGNAAEITVQVDTQFDPVIIREDIHDNGIYVARGAESVNVMDYGCVGDGVTDDTANFEAARAAAQSKGRPLFLPPGLTFKVAEIVPLWNGARMFADGATLDIQTDHTSTGRYLGLQNLEDVHVRGLRLKCSNATGRNQAYGMVSIFGGGDITLEGVWVSSGEGTGIFTGGVNTTTAAGVSNLHILRPRITGTYADGIHISRGASDVWVRDAYVTATGDDCIAVVSIQTDNGTNNYNQCARVHIINPSIINQGATGSGVALYGPKDCEVIGGRADTTTNQALYITTATGGNGAATHTAINNSAHGWHARNCGHSILVGTATDTLLDGCNGVGSTAYNLGIIGATRTVVVGGKFTGGAAVGVYATGGASNKLIAVDLHGNATNPSNVDANTVVDATCITA